MPLTGPRDMFAKALAGGFAVGAFNINNMETVPVSYTHLTLPTIA